MDGKPSAYLFWYKSSQDATTEYIYVIAFSRKQAWYFFRYEGYTRMYDYCEGPIDEIPSIHWKAKHEIGDILGQYAVI